MSPKMQMMQGISRFAPGPTPRKCAPAPAAGDGDEDAQLTFDRHGKLSNVDVVAIGKSRSKLPTMVDSICMQDGYNIFQ
jgi:hypothetical protein